MILSDALILTISQLQTEQVMTSYTTMDRLYAVFFYIILRYCLGMLSI